MAALMVRQAPTEQYRRDRGDEYQLYFSSRGHDESDRISSAAGLIARSRIACSCELLRAAPAAANRHVINNTSRDSQSRHTDARRYQPQPDARRLRSLTLRAFGNSRIRSAAYAAKA